MVHVVVVLLLVKILFSCTSFGSGTPGGIFMPIISISALAGSAFGLVAVHLGVPSKYLPVFIICSLAGGLSSCVKAPITSIVLTAELIGSFLHILPVAICSFVALLISDLLRTAPIYEALLNRYIEKHGYTIPLEDRPGELVEIPVEYDSKISGKLLRDIGWPKGSLIIGLRRGSEELIPKGETKIIPGDYLLIVTPKSDKHAIKQEIRHLCQKFDKNAPHGPEGSSLG